MDMNLVADGSSGIEHNIPTLAIYDDVLQFWGASSTAYTPTLTVTYGGLTSEDYFYQSLMFGSIRFCLSSCPRIACRRERFGE